MVVVGENAEFDSRVVAHGAGKVISIFVEISPARGKGSDQRNLHWARNSIGIRNAAYNAGLGKIRERTRSVGRKHEWRLRFRLAKFRCRNIRKGWSREASYSDADANSFVGIALRSAALIHSYGDYRSFDAMMP